MSTVLYLLNFIDLFINKSATTNTRMTNNRDYIKIKGVNANYLSKDQNLISKCRDIEQALLKEQVVSTQDASHAPWLITPEVFNLDLNLKAKLEDIGQGILHFFDAIQKLYPVYEDIRKALDFGVEEDLKGLDLEKRINTFRLDVIIENGKPKVAEIEETYSGIGLLHALSKAYPIDCDYYYQRIADTGIKYIFVDDQWTAYWGELQALQRRLKAQTGLDTTLKYLSAFEAKHEGVALRYEYTRDLSQYSRTHRKQITGGKVTYINPLFHGYPSKAVFALFFQTSLKKEWIKLLGEHYYQVLYDAFPKSKILLNPSSDEIQHLIDYRKKCVVKVVHSPEGLDYNWGSRGVYFGDTNKKNWIELLNYIKKGEIPYQPQIKNVVYLQTELIQSDRYDLPFWDKANSQISLMPKARIRLQPIFYRKNEKMELVASMATFVNTSKKVHLGSHAIQVPVEYI